MEALGGVLTILKSELSLQDMETVIFRSASNNAKVLINNRKVNVIGRVSMDSLAIDLNQVPGRNMSALQLNYLETVLPVEDLAVADWYDTLRNIHQPQSSDGHAD